MERSDERLSTRDIASPTSADDARFERDEPTADHAVTGDTMATMADPDTAAADRRPDRELRDPVDEPRGAVEDADALVATVMQRLAEGFAQERERLEAQWGRGEDISTEDLRIALQRYRSFFQRLLST